MFSCDEKIERCRNYLKTQTQPDAAAGLMVRKFVFDHLERSRTQQAANVFMACLGAFDRALCERYTAEEVERARSIAIDVFEELVTAVRDVQEADLGGASGKLVRNP